MDISLLKANLENKGYTVQCFATAAEACAYLTAALHGKTIGIGGSVTIRDLGLYESLSADNTVYWHWKEAGPEVIRNAGSAQVYLSSANAISQDGCIINIDGNGNRVAATLSPREAVYIIAGTNKAAETFEQAMWRARNVAAPLNARRLNRKTPCALGEELRCYDCKSPERICNSLNVLWHRPGNAQVYEIILIEEELGY